MVKVNLIGKKRRETRGKNWMFFGVIALYCGFLAYFFGSVIYTVYRLTSVNAELAAVEQESQAVSAEILKNNALLNRYVLSKFILEKIQSVNSTKFRYKDYLDQISSLMPPNAELKNVDFSVPGWVSVSVVVSNIKTLSLLEKSLVDEQILNKSLFSSVFSESALKDKLGIYSVKLQFEIRKNGGK